jgi:hypothetical protein
MLPLSVFVWLLFEGYNFVIRNWSYAGVPPGPWLRWPGYALAFATVLPAVFVTSDLLDRLLFGPGAAPPSAAEPLAGPPPGAPARWLVASGALLTAAPLLWPRSFFPAVWIGPIFLLDPLVERLGVRSLSLELAAGLRRRTVSLLLGGLACGLLWELWNFWAAAKWVYTVPFFGGWKVFEMPLLGFLGFPPFALECWILYHLLMSLLDRARAGLPRAAFWAGLAALSAALVWGIDQWTVTRCAAAGSAPSGVARCVHA